MKWWVQTGVIINICNYRYVISWTPDKSSLLSLMLDDVVGTQEIIDIRQDYCRLTDCIRSDDSGDSWYFTSSKAEGLQLPGSDEDYMLDVNTFFNIKVVQTIQEIDETNQCHKFLMYTENVPLGFALLQSVNTCPFPHCSIYQCLQNINGMHVPFLSSDLFVQYTTDHYIFGKDPGDTHKRQGPSIEIWNAYEDVESKPVLIMFPLYTAHSGHILHQSGPNVLGTSMAIITWYIVYHWLWLPSCSRRISTFWYKIDRMAHIVLSGRKGISMDIQPCSNAVLCCYETYFKTIHQDQM